MSASRRRLLQPLLAAAALLYLAAMVVTGAMPVQRQLVRFEAKGVMALAPERIRRVELSRGAERLTLLRKGQNEWMTAEGADVGAAGSRVSMAVQMMHTSAPVREVESVDPKAIDTAPFGLDPPRLSARLYEEAGEPVLVAHFGGYNPEEFLQYMRLDGDARLLLMSRFVGEEWSDAMNQALAK